MNYTVLTIAALILCFVAGLSSAQTKDEYLLDEPVCFTITNKERQMVYGHVETAPHPATGNRHRSTFKLDYNQSAQACTVGPFYQGRRVSFTIKTLFPLFQCKTSVYQPIIIKRQRDGRGDYKKNKDGYTIWAECY